MKRSYKVENPAAPSSPMSRSRSLKSLKFLMIGFATLYYLFLAASQIPLFFNNKIRNIKNPTDDNIPLFNIISSPPLPENRNKFLTNLVFTETKLDNNNSSLSNSALQAWVIGSNLWTHLTTTGPEKPITQNRSSNRKVNGFNRTTNCPHAISFSRAELRKTTTTNPTKTAAMVFPCGLRAGSHVTIVAKPRAAHVELVQQGGVMRDFMVCQFMLELRKVRRSNGTEEEEEARVLHFNPRIKGDWSGRPMIEMNACYRGKWGKAVRCEGSSATITPAEETVDGQFQCGNWIQEDDKLLLDQSKPAQTTHGWFNTLIMQPDQPNKNKLDHNPHHHAPNSPYPFTEEKSFVLTIISGLEGFHINVDGRHIASFAYRTGYDLEDATSLYIYGDIDVHSLHANSLPEIHPSITQHRYLEMSPQWKSPLLLPNDNNNGAGSVVVVELFIGIISAGDHFAERMAVRKSWLQHNLIRSSSSKVVARFFIALHEKEEINAELVKEADFFGDIVILPYLDNYDLVVLKTVAICEYGVNTLAANYIMKCDDDTFVRVDALVQIAQKFGAQESSIYVGKMNYFHTPLREGKWAVTFEEWAEEYYPPYADGAGYIISSDIARFIFSEFENNRLRLFKMEDVSLGMWVQQYNSSKPVHYLHSSRFVQSGCIDDYFTVHYQSPNQMACLWKKLERDGTPTCCNLR